MLKIAREKLGEFYKTLASGMPLFLPIKKADEVNFGYYYDGAEVDIDKLKSVKSPKNAFFPQSENMMRFRTEGKKIEIEDVRGESKPFAIFGVRACDFKAFSVLDNVFLGEPVDTYYKDKRDAATIFTLACNKPAQSCFCANFGIDASEPEGDVTCWLTEKELLLRPNTEKGEKALALVGDLTEACDDGEALPVKKEIAEKLEKLPYKKLDMSRFKPENLKELFDLPVWDSLSEACLGCGTCTFVCPTCQCFDIRDFKTDKGVVRYRCWDSCMYSDFTQMAAENPRTTQSQRFRQRFMHKLVYYPSQYGPYSCVGCGRCVDKCPQRLNIIKVIKSIGGERND